MRVFITGGSGFIGEYTLKELKKRGHRLLVLSRKNRHDAIADYIKGDLSDVAKWEGRLKKFRPEAAVHLAWEGIPDFSYARSAKNLETGLAFFDALAAVGCKKIVAIGTGYEFGRHVGRADEKLPVVPINAIAAAKHSLHVMGETLAKENGIDFIWLRPCRPYGDGQREESLIPYTMRCVAGNISLRLRRPLEQEDFVHVADVARAVADAVARGRGQATYNVGSGKLTPVRDIAKMVCEAMGASKEYRKDFMDSARGNVLPAAYADLANIRKDLGWKPTKNMREAINAIVKKYENNRNRI